MTETITPALKSKISETMKLMKDKLLTEELLINLLLANNPVIKLKSIWLKLNKILLTLLLLWPPPLKEEKKVMLFS